MSVAIMHGPSTSTTSRQHANNSNDSATSSHSYTSVGQHSFPGHALNGSDHTASTSQSVKATSVSLDNLLSSSSGDLHGALSKLLQSHNSLLHKHEVVQSEHDRLVNENAKLWSWCSGLKKERDSLQREVNNLGGNSSREIKTLSSRVVELEGMLVSNGISVPPPSSSRLSPVYDTVGYSSGTRTASAAVGRPPPSPRSHSDTSASHRERQGYVQGERERNGILSNSHSVGNLSSAASSSSRQASESGASIVSGLSEEPESIHSTRSERKRLQSGSDRGSDRTRIGTPPNISITGNGSQYASSYLSTSVPGSPNPSLPSPSSPIAGVPMPFAHRYMAAAAAASSSAASSPTTSSMPPLSPSSFVTTPSSFSNQAGNEDGIGLATIPATPRLKDPQSHAQKDKVKKERTESLTSQSQPESPSRHQFLQQQSDRQQPERPHLQISKASSTSHLHSPTASSFPSSEQSSQSILASPLHSPRSPHRLGTRSSPSLPSYHATGLPASPRAYQYNKPSPSASSEQSQFLPQQSSIASSKGKSTGTTAGTHKVLRRKASSLDLGTGNEKTTPPLPSRSATPPPDLGSPNPQQSPLRNDSSPIISAVPFSSPQTARYPHKDAFDDDDKTPGRNTHAFTPTFAPKSLASPDTTQYAISSPVSLSDQNHEPGRNYSGGLTLPSPVSPFGPSTPMGNKSERKGTGRYNPAVKAGGLGIIEDEGTHEIDKQSDNGRYPSNSSSSSDPYPRPRKDSSTLQATSAGQTGNSDANNSNGSVSSATGAGRISPQSHLHSNQAYRPTPQRQTSGERATNPAPRKIATSVQDRDIHEARYVPPGPSATTQELKLDTNHLGTAHSQAPVSPARSTRHNVGSATNVSDQSGAIAVFEDSNRVPSMYSRASSTTSLPHYPNPSTYSLPLYPDPNNNPSWQSRAPILHDPPPRRPFQQQQPVPNLRSSSKDDYYGDPKAGAAPSYGLKQATPTPLKCLPLVPGILPFVNVEVVNSSIKIADRGREVVSFLIRVAVRSPPEQDPRYALMVAGVPHIWIIEKTWNDLQNIDIVIKSKNTKADVRKVPPLPDKSLFKDHAPSKVDQRKTDLQRCLQGLCASKLHELGDYCTFLTSNIVSDRAAPVSNPGYKAGYLTKKGRNFGGWTTRYYVLHGRMLEYYDTPGGQHLGSIDIKDANIGRQNNSKTNAGADDSIRHAFLIRAKDKSGEDTDHILCAESDEERDHWVNMLVCCLTGEYVPETVASTVPQNQTRQPPASYDRLKHPTKKGSKDFEITKTVAQPISQLQQGSQNSKLFSAPTYTEEKRPPTYQQDLGASMHRREQSAGQSSTASITEDQLPAQRGIRTGRGHRGSDMAHSSSVPANLDQISASDSLSSLSGVASSLPPFKPNVNNQPEREAQSASSRPKSPEKKIKISAPSNGAPIGADFKQRNPDKRAKYKSSFWHFAGRAGPERRDPNAVQARPVFGVPIGESVEIARVKEDSDLPAVVFRCVQYLSSVKAENEEGIYRMSGSSAVIKALKDRFNAEGDVDLTSEYFDPHAVAGLLKTFFRELPVHIFTNELNSDFIKANEIENHSQKLKELCRLVQQLPVANYSALRFLSAHIVQIVHKESVNKMSVRNMGIVFSPTLAIPATLFALFINEFDRIFREVDADEPEQEVPDDTLLTRQNTISPDATPRPNGPSSRRRSQNSVLFTKSGADRLLEAIGALEAPDEEELSESQSETEHSRTGSQPPR